VAADAAVRAAVHQQRAVDAVAGHPLLHHTCV
jgi:hypothetical protein